MTAQLLSFDLDFYGTATRRRSRSRLHVADFGIDAADIPVPVNAEGRGPNTGDPETDTPDIHADINSSDDPDVRTHSVDINSSGAPDVNVAGKQNVPKFHPAPPSLTPAFGPGVLPQLPANLSALFPQLPANLSALFPQVPPNLSPDIGGLRSLEEIQQWVMSHKTEIAIVASVIGALIAYKLWMAKEFIAPYAIAAAKRAGPILMA